MDLLFDHDPDTGERWSMNQYIMILPVLFFVAIAYVLYVLFNQVKKEEQKGEIEKRIKKEKKRKDTPMPKRNIPIASTKNIPSPKISKHKNKRIDDDDY
eukprot:TRINITY_DN6520_c0_g1_i1.p1 TRINITY_DN6520_c0_g1~~TRINITY_DN6520_c0_g1_i1.p1  ORF type:complete len:108 (-),score=32.21 TRINITY_DN6520_c0_g1_i1:145-441(-)